MVDVKQAIQRAKDYAIQVLELDPKEMLLEEIRPSSDVWGITLSFNSRTGPVARNEFAKLIRPYDETREFKTFQVNKVTGEVEGMFNVQPV
jgi:hypothetical protein